MTIERTRALDGTGADTTAGSLAVRRLDPSRLVGEILNDKYRVDELIGRGGMAYVYRAHHLSLDRKLAIKVLDSSAGDRPIVARRFEREAKAVSRLSHPNVLHVTDFGTAHGIPFLVMELIEGDELSHFLGRPVPPAEVVGVAVQILRGLQHAHERGVVHRDLKPSNVFVARDHSGRSVMKIVDFGISKLADADPNATGATRAGMVFGTPRYMSPEQATGAADVDGRADLYSLGILMYEMLTGSTPFTAKDAVALLRKHVTQQPPPLPKSVPSALRHIVERLLAKDRDERYPDAGSVLRDIQPRDAPPRSSAPSGPRPPAPPPPRAAAPPPSPASTGVPRPVAPAQTPVPDAASFARAFALAMSDAGPTTLVDGSGPSTRRRGAGSTEGGAAPTSHSSAPITMAPVDVDLNPIRLGAPRVQTRPPAARTRHGFSEGPLLPTLVGIGALTAAGLRGWSLHARGATMDDIVVAVAVAGLGAVIGGWVLVTLLRRFGL